MYDQAAIAVRAQGPAKCAETLRRFGLRRTDIIQQKLPYIHRNPVEEGLVEEPHHYLYSSARDGAGMPGMLKLETIWGEVITDNQVIHDEREDQ